MMRPITLMTSKPISGVVMRVVALLLLHAVPGAACCAQTVWNDSTTRALVELATRLRAAQLTDTGLTDYHAEAHGYLTFLAQVGQGFVEPPRIVKADELALEVYWRAPNLSKQRIVGRRDTLLLPTDIAYHRDHLGIVQNNFPAIIRLGEGDEVRDVPHPLSRAGLDLYDFAVGDSLRIDMPGRRVNVYEVRVRPKDDRQPRVVGAVYIDRSEGQVVRMALTFTRAALLDNQLEDVSIVLENRLVGSRFWLPSRQEIEIRRTGTWLDYPVRGIIRGRWEIGDYEINKRVPYSMFGSGPEIVQAPQAEQRRHVWSTPRVLDSLPPDVRAVTDADVRRVQAEARALVRAHALQRTRNLALSGRGISDFVRVDRVEGLAFGGGLTQRVGGGVSVAGRARYGIDDRRLKGQGLLEWQSGAGLAVRAFLQRDFREVGDEPERSRVLNSIAAQEFGSDYTDPFDVLSGGLAIENAPPGESLWRLEVAAEQPYSLAVHASPVEGRFLAPIDAQASPRARVTLRRERPSSLWFLGTELRTAVELRGLRSYGSATSCLPSFAECRSEYTTIRGALIADVERPFGRQRILLHTIGGAVGGKGDVIPSTELFYFGGPISGAGYDFHQLVGRAGVSQRVEWRFPVPFVALPLGRFGTIPASATLAPYGQLMAIGGGPVALSRGGQLFSTSVPGGYAAAGVGLLAFFDLVRFDVSRGFRGGRWLFSIDVNSEFWSIL
ncbi:MAG: hypothetical protein DMD26_08055 [Gemmatimonadetes bacterium]|nr:MAG: hypothetical protein DMD26_08055 [Gemmatimonadota bacterium]